MQELLKDIRERPRFFPLLFQFFPENFFALFRERSRCIEFSIYSVFETVYNYVLYNI